MAGWQRTPAGKVSVYYYMNGKQKKLPRAETTHLDNEPDHNIEYWITNWELSHQVRRVPTVRLSDTEVIKLLDRFCKYMQSRGKDERTIRGYRNGLLAYTLPFFVEIELLRSPSFWPSRSIKLLAHMETTLGLGPRTINTYNVALRRFWHWMTEEGIVDQPLRLRNAIVGGSKTPLKFTITPKDVLDHVYGSPKIRLIALIGFFFSLRSQELAAICPSDFKGGSKVTGLECCKVMAKAKLYSRFAAKITKQKSGKNIKGPKNNSTGWVACFDERAAREIVELLRDLPPTEPIWTTRPDWLYKVWGREGFPGITIKDLRRASIYWLGHYGGMDFTALKNHARHSDPSTTALYVRRPDDLGDEDDWVELDLDA